MHWLPAAVPSPPALFDCQHRLLCCTTLGWAVLHYTVLFCTVLCIADQKPTLSVSPAGGQAYTEDTVLLPCGLQSNQSQNQNHERWKYYWYRGSQSAYPLEQIWDGGGGEAVLRLWRSRASDTGQYWCRAGRGQPTFYTEFSDPVYVNITGESVCVEE